MFGRLFDVAEYVKLDALSAYDCESRGRHFRIGGATSQNISGVPSPGHHPQRWYTTQNINPLASAELGGERAVHGALHQLTGSFELLQETIYFRNRSSTTVSNTLTSAAVNNFRMLTLLWSHGHDDGLDALERAVVDIHIFDGLAHTRNHGREVLDVNHLLNLLDLIIEIHQ